MPRQRILTVHASAQKSERIKPRVFIVPANTACAYRQHCTHRHFYRGIDTPFKQRRATMQQHAQNISSTCYQFLGKPCRTCRP